MKNEIKFREPAAVFGRNPSVVFYQMRKSTLLLGNVASKPKFSCKYINSDTFSAPRKGISYAKISLDIQELNMISHTKISENW